MERDLESLNVVTLTQTEGSAKGLAEMPSGELLVASKSAVWLMQADNKLKLHAGSSTELNMVFGYRLDARFKELGAIRYLEFDGVDGLFIVDRDSCIVSLLVRDTVSPFVGRPGSKGRKDGHRENATLNFPTDVTVFRDIMFITDYSNDCVRMVTPGGMVSTIGGGKRVLGDIPFSEAEFKNPFGILAMDDGLYVSEHIRSRIRKINLDTKTVSLVAGTNRDDFLDGIPSDSLWNMVRGLCSDSLGNIYAADCRNDLIRLLTPNEVRKVVGALHSSESVDGPISVATTRRPYFLIITSAGDLIWTEEYSKMVRMVAGFAPPRISTCLSLLPPLIPSIFPSFQIPYSPYSISIIPQMIQLTFPHLVDIPSFVESCPSDLAPALPAFFALLHRSFDLFQVSSSIEMVITISHVVQLLAHAGMKPNETILGQHLLFNFAKAVRSRPLASLLSLIYSGHCSSFDMLLEQIFNRLAHYSMPEIDLAVSQLTESSSPPHSFPNAWREKIQGISVSTLSMKPPSEGPFTDLDAALVQLSQSPSPPSPFTICIAESETKVIVSDWVLSAQWPWFRALLQSGMEEASSRVLELPSNFPSSLLSLIICHLHFGKVHAPLEEVENCLEYLYNDGPQFGFMDLEGQPLEPFTSFLSKLKSLQNEERLKRDIERAKDPHLGDLFTDC